MKHMLFEQLQWIDRAESSTSTCRRFGIVANASGSMWIPYLMDRMGASHVVAEFNCPTTRVAAKARCEEWHRAVQILQPAPAIDSSSTGRFQHEPARSPF
jgi:hypothetical protein